jgi:hypothetical protein
MKPLSVEEERTSPEFFNESNFVLQFCPTHPSEIALMERFAKLNIGGGKKFDVQSLPSEVQKAIKDGMAGAWNAYDETQKKSLIAIAGPLITGKRDLIISLANKSRLPTIFAFRYYAEAGGLASYGVDNLDLYRRAASYVDRILRGEKPSELPVQEATKFQLVINLKTAKALGLNVPQSLLATADEVIE